MAQDRGPARGADHPHRRTISGRWATPAPAAPVRRSSSTRGSQAAARLADEDGDASWRSGTSSSCSSSSPAGEPRAVLPRPSSTRAWGWSACRPWCRASLQLRHRPVQPLLAATTPRPASHRRASAADVPRHRRPPAPRAFLVADGVSPPTRDAATSCAASCGGPSPRPSAGSADLLHRIVRPWSPRWARPTPSCAGPRPSSRTMRAGGGGFPAHPRQRPAPARRGDRRARESGVLPGATAFKLYDTYGFPLDLTAERRPRQGPGGRYGRLRRGHGLQRQHRAGGLVGLGPTARRRAVGRTSRPARPDPLHRLRRGRVAAPRCWPWCATAREVDAAQAGQTVEVLFDPTPFYAESGGQAGDRGEVEWPAGAGECVGTCSKQAGDLFVHTDRRSTRGALARRPRAPGGRRRRRARTRANHSATHLLHAALRTCSARTSPRRARWSTASACASTSATAAR